jgi:hypothetical protein
LLSGGPVGSTLQVDKSNLFRRYPWIWSNSRFHGRRTKHFWHFLYCKKKFHGTLDNSQRACLRRCACGRGFTSPYSLSFYRGLTGHCVNFNQCVVVDNKRHSGSRTRRSSCINPVRNRTVLCANTCKQVV